MLENKRLQKLGNLHWIHWLVLFFSALLTLGASYFMHHQAQEKIKEKFETESNQIIELVYERLTKYEDALWSGVAAIHSQSHGIDYNEWKRFSDTLHIEKKYPGINGIGIIYHVLPENLENYLKQQRELRPDYKIYPDHGKDEYLPITYIEPVELNEKAVGLDMAHEESRYKAAITARDKGLGTVTAPIILVQDAEKTPGFLFYVPFYKEGQYETIEERQENFIGLVYAPFVAKNLMAGVLESDKRKLFLNIKDNGVTLYDERKENEINIDPNPLFHKTISIEKYGRVWEFDIETKKTFRDYNKNNKPIIILIGGILIDTLLFIVFFLLSNSNKRALNFSNKVLDKYQKKISELENISQKLSDTQKFQELVLNTIPSYIFVKDNKFRIMQANQSFIQNYPEDKRNKIIGYTTLEEYPEKQADKFLKNDKIALETGYHQTEETIDFPNGQTRTLMTTKIGFKDAGKPYLLGISHDITPLKEAEQEIMRSNSELERFAFLASHDLQEPLRMINSFTELLRDEYQDNFDDQAKFYMDTVVDASGRMQMLIRDLLDYSQVQKNDNAYEETNTNVCLNECLDNLSELIKSTNAQIQSDTLPNIHSIPVRFTRVLQNIIGNAIKYKHPDRIPEIYVSYTETEREFIFSVKDNGIGIQKEYLDQVFILFKRLHNKDEYSGTGIGLAICQKIVESFKGKFWIESEIEQGSIFYFSVPKKIKDDK